MIEAKMAKNSLEKINFFIKKDKREEKKKTQESKSGTDFNEYGYGLFSRIQHFFFYLSLLLIPVMLFPLEWVMFEYGRVFVLMFFTIILLTFELIKFFIRGKLEIYKSPRDSILWFLTLSLLISFLFSSDSLLSLWGYEFRLGTGLVSLLTILTYLLILKSMVKDFKILLNLIFFLTIGLIFSAFLSILSFYGISPMAFLPEFEKFFFVGLPLFSSAKLSIGIWSVGILLSLFSFYYFFTIFSDDESYLNKKLSVVNAYRKKRSVQIIMIIVFVLAIATFIFAISLFSIKSLSWLGVVSFIIIGLISCLATFLSSSKALRLGTILVLSSVLLIFGLSRLTDVQGMLSIDRENIVEQVTLENQAIWSITVSSLSESFARGLVGLGNDNFIVAYNQYRPAFSGEIDLNFVNYSYANNEIYNIVANRGLIGLFIWLGIGFLIGKQFVQYLVNDSRKQILKSDSFENVAIILLDLALIFIWLFAFFAYYSFIFYFIFLFILVLSSLFRSIAYKMHSESLVIQTNFFVEKIGQVKSDSLPKFFIIFICAVSVFSLYTLLNDFTSRVYAVKAESIIYDASGSISEEAFQRAIENYDEAIARNPKNYVFRRKVSSVLMDYINKVLAKDYSTLSEENEKQEYIRIIGVYGEAAIEEANKATDLAPMVAANWSNRDLVYSDLVRMGFQNYLNTGLKISEQTIMRSPSNYIPYVNKATYLYLSGDSGGAIGYVRQALEINPYNVSALALGSEIAMGMQDYVSAKNYLENAKVLLESMDLNKSEVFNLYEQVEKNLEYIWSLEIGGSLVKEETETEEEIVEKEELVLPDEEIAD